MKKIISLMSFLLISNVFAFSFRFHLGPQYTRKISYGGVGWTSGTNWIVPSGVSKIKIVVFGGGGSGASCWYIGAGCSGGSAGSYVLKTLWVNSGDVISVSSLGVGGSGVSSCYATGSCGTVYRNGNSGGSTTVAITGHASIVAGGGAGGLANTSAISKPANWATFNTDLENFKITTTDGTGITSYTTNSLYISYAGSNTYPSATYSGGQAGYTNNGGVAMFMTRPSSGGMGIISSTSGIVASGSALSASVNSGAGGGASVGTTTGGNNGTASGDGGSGGAIILY